jgi:hypothetical protein
MNRLCWNDPCKVGDTNLVSTALERRSQYPCLVDSLPILVPLVLAFSSLFWPCLSLLALIFLAYHNLILDPCDSLGQALQCNSSTGYNTLLTLSLQGQCDYQTPLIERELLCTIVLVQNYIRASL